MKDTLPEGWIPTPFGVADSDVAELAARLSRAAAESFPGFVDCEESRNAVAKVIAWPRATETTVGRVWHMLGPDATGAVADLSIVEDATSVPDSPFEFTLPQRTWSFDGGHAALSLVAPLMGVPKAVMLRAQRRDGTRVLVADVFGDLPLLGLVLDDVIALVGAERPPEA